MARPERRRPKGRKAGFTAPILQGRAAYPCRSTLRERSNPNLEFNFRLDDHSFPDHVIAPVQTGTGGLRSALPTTSGWQLTSDL